MSDLKERLRRAIVDVPDYPKPGILFRDLTPVYQDPALLREITAYGVARAREWKAGAVAGIESRGFMLGATMAMEAKLPFVMVRKKDKLPRERLAESYALEYGEATIEAHVDSFRPAQRVLLVDDLLATGGTAAAAARLVERLGATTAGYLFIVELTFLKGRERLGEPPAAAMLAY